MSSPARADRHRSKDAAIVAPEQTPAAPIEAELFELGNLGRPERVHRFVSTWLRHSSGIPALRRPAK
jgi:hypothetical protein